MKLTYSDIQIKGANGDELKAAQLFTKELSKRTGIAPEGFGKTGKTVIVPLNNMAREIPNIITDINSFFLLLFI